MSKKKVGFRIFGDELGRDVSYVDVSVSGADRNGNIYLEEIVDDGSVPQEWVFDAERLGNLYEEDLICPSDEIPVEGHSMWTTLVSIGETRSAVDINNFVDKRLRDSAKSLFRALIEAGK